MTVDGLLAALVIVLAPFSWLSTGILGWAAKKPPRIGALTERAVIALVIAVMVTTGGLLTFNRTNGYALFDINVARILFSLSIITLASLPLAWCVLWFTGRLGGTTDGELRALALRQALETIAHTSDDPDSAVIARSALAADMA